MWRGLLAFVVVMLAGGAYVLWVLSGILFPPPRTGRETLPIKATMCFSPDGNAVAYLYRDATYFFPAELGARPLTMTDSLEIRWFHVKRPAGERSLPLDAIDLRPDGVVYYNLRGRVCFSPDSKRLAGICANYIILVDLQSGSARKIEYDKEYFGSLAWLSADEIVFTTSDEDNLTFWRLGVEDAVEDRWQVYRETHTFPRSTYPTYPSRRAHLPPGLRWDSWSPDRRHVIFARRMPGEEKEGLLDLATGTVRTFPLPLYHNYWKPDGSVVLVIDQYGDKGQIALIDAKTGNATDLTVEFNITFGAGRDITCLGWTSDEKYVILHNTRHLPPATRDGPGRMTWTGHVVQLQPFKLILSSDRLIRPSPIPGWVLLQGDDTFDWMDYAGTRMVELNGWPNDWIWSPDGQLAARVSDAKVVVFHPALPGE